MFNRAVTAFRKSIQKSRSSSNLESDGDDVESVASSSYSSYSIATSNASHGGSGGGRSDAPPLSGGSGFLNARRRFRRSRSVNREGVCWYLKLNYVDFIKKNLRCSWGANTGLSQYPHIDARCIEFFFTGFTGIFTFIFPYLIG